VIRDHVNKDSWGETIPLVASLAGRRANLVVQAILDAFHAETQDDPNDLDAFFDRNQLSVELLLRCLEDEIQVSRSVAREACLVLAEFDNAFHETELDDLLTGKFGADFVDISWKVFRGDASNLGSSGSSALLRSRALALGLQPGSLVCTAPDVLSAAIELLRSDDLQTRCEASLLLMQAGYEVSGNFEEDKEDDEERVIDSADIASSELQSALDSIVNRINSQLSDSAEEFAVLWAFAWLAQVCQIDRAAKLDLLSTLLDRMLRPANPAIVRVAAWATREVGSGDSPVGLKLTAAESMTLLELARPELKAARNDIRAFQMRAAWTFLHHSGHDLTSLPSDRLAEFARPEVEGDSWADLLANWREPTRFTSPGGDE
jgi:hypothetical protein